MGSPCNLHLSSTEREDVLTALRVWKKHVNQRIKDKGLSWRVREETLQIIKKLYDKIDCAGEGQS